MERFSTCDLKQKEVINVCDGTRLGYPSDFEFDIGDGRITALVVPRPSGFLGLSHEHDLIISWCHIECIGEDAILVRLPTDARCDSERERRKKKKSFW
jgi:YlmC/YmxH family sporulation protein